MVGWKRILICTLEALDALAKETAFSTVNLSSLNSLSFTARSCLRNTNLSFIIYHQLIVLYSHDFPFFFQPPDELIHRFRILLCYLPELLSFENNVLSVAAIPLELLRLSSFFSSRSGNWKVLNTSRASSPAKFSRIAILIDLPSFRCLKLSSTYHIVV